MAVLETMDPGHSSPMRRGMSANIARCAHPEHDESIMDIVYLHGLRLETVIGVWDWERHIRQTLIVDLDMRADVARAAASDSIDDTIDYKTIADRLVEIAAESSYTLVETLAERIAGELTGPHGIEWVRVKISKTGALRGARDVGVVIERGSRD